MIVVYLSSSKKLNIEIYVNGQNKCFFFQMVPHLLILMQYIQRFFSSNLPSENSCNFLNIASKLTNEVPFERRNTYFDHLHIFLYLASWRRRDMG
jgi:hypothetical protein